VALLEKRGFLYNHSGDFPQVILIVPSHVPNSNEKLLYRPYVPYLIYGNIVPVCSVWDTNQQFFI
jgi:hypothetical protein